MGEGVGSGRMPACLLMLLLGIWAAPAGAELTVSGQAVKIHIEQDLLRLRRELRAGNPAPQLMEIPAQHLSKVLPQDMREMQSLLRSYDEAGRSYLTLTLGLKDSPNPRLQEYVARVMQLLQIPEEEKGSIVAKLMASRPQPDQPQAQREFVLRMARLRELTDRTAHALDVPGLPDQKDAIVATTAKPVAQVVLAPAHTPAETMVEELRRDPEAETAEVVQLSGSDGKPREAVRVVFRDGSSRLETPDARLSIAHSKDGRTVLMRDDALGSYQHLQDGKEIVSWDRDPATGEFTGAFHGRSFQAAPEALLLPTSDGQTLLVAMSAGPKAPPVVVQWLSASGQEWRRLPGDIGALYKIANGKGSHLEVRLNPEALQQGMKQGHVDLSAVPEEVVPPETAEAFARLLEALPRIWPVYKEKPLAAFIADRKLNYILPDDVRITALVTDGKEGRKTEAYIFIGETVFLAVFDPAFRNCEMFTTNTAKQLTKGQIEFEARARWWWDGEAWNNIYFRSFEVKKFSWRDKFRAGTKGALDGLRKPVSLVFEVVTAPVQTALYGLESLIWMSAGTIGKTIDRESFRSQLLMLSAEYTARQGDLHRVLGQGLSSEAEVLAVYRAGSKHMTRAGKELLEGYLNEEVRKERRKAQGKLYVLNQDAPVTNRDRAYAAAQQFGLKNLAGRYFAHGKESFSRGDRTGTVGNYLAGGLVIGGESYLTSFGTGLATQHLKAFMLAKATGLTSTQLAAAMKNHEALSRGVKGIELTAREQQAVNWLKTAQKVQSIYYGALGTFETTQMIVDGMDTLADPGRLFDRAQAGEKFDAAYAKLSKKLFRAGVDLVQKKGGDTVITKEKRERFWKDYGDIIRRMQARRKDGKEVVAKIDETVESLR